MRRVAGFAGFVFAHLCVIMREMMHDEHCRSYKKRVGHVTRLLRSAIDSGKKGLAESDIYGVRKRAATTIRAYDSALLCSLDVSLTKWHCDSIDEKSHRIEMLLYELQAKILQLQQTQSNPTHASTTASSPQNGDLSQSVPLFLAHCARVQIVAEAMRCHNAQLMCLRRLPLWQ